MEIVPSDYINIGVVVPRFRVLRGGSLHILHANGAEYTMGVADNQIVDIPIQRIFATGTTASGFLSETALRLPPKPNVNPGAPPPPRDLSVEFTDTVGLFAWDEPLPYAGTFSRYNVYLNGLFIGATSGPFDDTTFAFDAAAYWPLDHDTFGVTQQTVDGIESTAARLIVTSGGDITPSNVLRWDDGLAMRWDDSGFVLWDA